MTSFCSIILSTKIIKQYICTYWFDQFVLERIMRKIWRTNKTGNSFNAIVNKNNIGAIINTRENHKTFIQIGISSFSKKFFRSMSMLLSPRLVQMIVTHQSSYLLIDELE